MEGGSGVSIANHLGGRDRSLEGGTRHLLACENSSLHEVRRSKIQSMSLMINLIASNATTHEIACAHCLLRGGRYHGACMNAVPPARFDLCNPSNQPQGGAGETMTMLPRGGWGLASLIYIYIYIRVECPFRGGSV